MKLSTGIRLLLLCAGLFPALPVHATVGDTWEQVDLSDHPLRGRFGQGLASFQGKLWSVGGWSYRCSDYHCNIGEEYCPPCDLIGHDDLWVSEDGEIWTLVYAHAPFGVRTNACLFTFQGGLYVMGGNYDWFENESPNPVNVWRSTDGTNWEAVSAQPGLSSIPPTLVFKDHLVTVNTPTISWDGFAWEDDPDFPLGFPRDDAPLEVRAAAVLDNIIYVFASTEVWRSSDNYHWTKLGGNTGELRVDRQDRTAMASFAGYLWLAGRFVPEGGGGDHGAIWRSRDGENWIEVRRDYDSISLGSALCANGVYLYYTGSESYWYDLRTFANCQELSIAGHSADTVGCGSIGLGELLRVIQFFSLGSYHCNASGEDGYAPGPAPEGEGAPAEGATEGEPAPCVPYSSDYSPQDWKIGLNELLRLIQLYNAGSYTPCPNPTDTEDGFCIGGESAKG